MAPRQLSDDDDEFGLSSSDESALLVAADAPAAPSAKRQREADPDDAPPTKRPAAASPTPAYPTTSPLAVKILKQRFGLDKFRLEQEAVNSRILAGGSAVVVFPTGGGKSLCYQVCHFALHLTPHSYTVQT